MEAVAGFKFVKHLFGRKVSELRGLVRATRFSYSVNDVSMRFS
jgi:hypothetical protein